MLQSFEQQIGGPIHRRSLAIPFEMYCCRVVLQQARAHKGSSCQTFIKWGWEFCVKGTRHVSSNEATCISVPKSGKTNTVRAGDICLDNAQANGITIADLERPNLTAQSGSNPQIGEVLYVSDPRARSPSVDSSSTYSVKAGDIFWDIAKANGITVAEIEAWNPEVQCATNLQVGQVLCISKPRERPSPCPDPTPTSLTGNSMRYAVKNGDLGWTIAQAHNISLDDLKSWNPNVVWTNLRIGQLLYVSPPGRVSTAPPSPPGKFNGDVFIEYIGAQHNGVRFSDVPINRNVSFHYILAFAIDYTTNDGIRPCDGVFNIHWQQSVLTPEAIKSIKAQYSKVKVMLSIGGDSISHQSVQFSPKSEKSWVKNAVDSLTSLIKKYHLDGIDISYQHFENSSPELFATCIGQLITQMKERRLISLASIAPFDGIESHYLKLWGDHGDLIDYVNFQFYAYSTETTEEEYVNLYREAAVKYGGGSKVLAGFNTSPNTGPLPGTVLAASHRLQNNGRLPGIFIWSADSSRSSTFKYDTKAQALLAREE